MGLEPTTAWTDLSCVQNYGWIVDDAAGPVAEQGFDVALTEVICGREHHFAVEVGSERGAQVLAEVPSRPAGPADCARAAEIHARTVSQIGRELDTTGS